MKKICDRVVQKLYEDMNVHTKGLKPWGKQNLFVKQLYIDHASDLRKITRAQTKET